jgi:uncharacterized protein involved in exopolysaccharide biosynthesis
VPARKGKITDGIQAETGLEHQLILAVERLEAEYAEREAAMHARLDILSGQVNDLSGQIESLTRQLTAFGQQVQALQQAFKSG